MINTAQYPSPPITAVYLWDLPKEERDFLYGKTEYFQARPQAHPKFYQYIKRETYIEYFPKGSIIEFEECIEYVRAFFKRKDYKHMMFGARCSGGSKGQIFIYFYQLQYKINFSNHKPKLLEYIKELLSLLEKLEKL